MQAIGIDLGTTSICAVVLDTDTGEVIRSVSKNSDAFLKTENDFEKIQSPEKMIDTALELLDALMTDQTAAIGVTGQMHGIVYTDKNGRSVSPLYTWQDGRGNLEYENGISYARHLGSFSGYGNVTDFYNRKNGRRPVNAEGFCTIQDYLVMRLCGRKKAVVHVSDAASFGCFDLQSKKYYIDCEITVADGYVIAGEYKGVPVSIAIGDNQASALSTTTEEDVLINIGTGSQISFIHDAIIEAEGMETRPYFENKYLIVGSALCGGRAYALLRDFYKRIFAYRIPLTDSEVYAVMGEMAKKDIPPLPVDTRFSGTRARENIRGSITGISTENFVPEALTAGVLEGMISELTDMYEGSGIAKKGLVGSGNGIRKNEALVRIAERKLNMPMKIPKNMEEAAVGAAMYAGIASGIYPDMQQASTSVIRYM